MWNRETPYPPSREEMALTGYINRRVRGFGLTLIVMGLSFLFYYLGLFGGVSGPLNADRLGDTLVDLGVTRLHLTFALLTAAVCALSWNWIYNLVSRAVGRRLTCAKQMDNKGRVCAEPVKVLKIKDMKTDRPVKRYVCPQGHKMDISHFHPVKKGLVGHTVWLVAVTCLLIFVGVG